MMRWMARKLELWLNHGQLGSQVTNNEFFVGKTMLRIEVRRNAFLTTAPIGGVTLMVRKR